MAQLPTELCFHKFGTGMQTPDRAILCVLAPGDASRFGRTNSERQNVGTALPELQETAAFWAHSFQQCMSHAWCFPPPAIVCFRAQP